MATTGSLFSEIILALNNCRCRINSPLRKRGQDQGKSHGPTSIHGPTTKVTGVLRNLGGNPTMSLAAHRGDLLPGVHPLIIITNTTRVIKLRALVMGNRKHRSLLRVQPSLHLRNEKWLKLFLCYCLKQVQQQLPVTQLSLANNKVLQHRLCNCKLQRGWSLLPNLTGRLNFTKLLWNAFKEAWFIITVASQKTFNKLNW